MTKESISEFNVRWIMGIVGTLIVVLASGVAGVYATNVDNRLDRVESIRDTVIEMQVDIKYIKEAISRERPANN